MLVVEVGEVARVVHHQDASVARWRFLRELMQTDGCREVQSLFLCQLMKLLHERKETLAGLHRPVAVDLQLVDILDAVRLVHLHDALQDFLRQSVGAFPHHVVDNKYGGDDFFFAEYILFRGYGGTGVRGCGGAGVRGGT